MKYHVFCWDFSVRSASYDDYENFRDVFTGQAFDELRKHFGSDDDVYPLYEISDFDPHTKGGAIINFPVEFYDESVTEPMFEAIDDACDDAFGTWGFEQDSDTEF